VAHILENAYIELKKNLASLGIIEYLRYSKYNEKCWSHLFGEGQLDRCGIATKTQEFTMMLHALEIYTWGIGLIILLFLIYFIAELYGGWD
jgi:hypothetical protein